uniref:RING-type E3 ubiquitin transferase n=1 Tax=Glossina brevipalpis TaxID=37001 RepID=A0A1A9VZU4_9MUSC
MNHSSIVDLWECLARFNAFLESTENIKDDVRVTDLRTRTQEMRSEIWDILTKQTFEMCSICLEYYDMEQFIHILPCRHKFHNDCVKKWLQIKRNCPLCQRYRTVDNIIITNVLNPCTFVSEVPRVRVEIKWYIIIFTLRAIVYRHAILSSVLAGLSLVFNSHTPFAIDGNGLQSEFRHFPQTL